MINEKWVRISKSGSNDDCCVNTYQICKYLKVGQVGQNQLTHFPDFNSLSSSDLIILGQSGSGFPERDSGNKDKMEGTKCQVPFLFCKKDKTGGWSQEYLLLASESYRRCLLRGTISNASSNTECWIQFLFCKKKIKWRIHSVESHS